MRDKRGEGRKRVLKIRKEEGKKIHPCIKQCAQQLKRILRYERKRKKRKKEKKGKQRGKNTSRKHTEIN